MVKHAVIGIGFGDEGKGHVVDWLCSKSLIPIVYRFSGGPNAAHHVVLENGIDHVFSNFGSGTLRGVKTIWNKDCYVNPIALLTEFDALKRKGINPSIHIDSRCKVITPFDIFVNNRLLEHGTTGSGMYPTFARNNDGCSLNFGDLYNPSVLDIKVRRVEDYYKDNRRIERGYRHIRDNFSIAMEELKSTRDIEILNGEFRLPHLREYVSEIYEGTQGVLLDQTHGFFPHVTPSNTGLKNLPDNYCYDLWLVTRAYQTRHGNGPMSVCKSLDDIVRRNPYEQNSDDSVQGEFRRTMLDVNLLEYSIDCLSKERDISKFPVNLVVTCCDLMDKYALFYNGKEKVFKDEKSFLMFIVDKLKIDIKRLYMSYGPTAKGVAKYDEKY